MNAILAVEVWAASLSSRSTDRIAKIQFTIVQPATTHRCPSQGITTKYHPAACPIPRTRWETFYPAQIAQFDTCFGLQPIQNSGLQLNPKVSSAKKRIDADEVLACAVRCTVHMPSPTLGSGLLACLSGGAGSTAANLSQARLFAERRCAACMNMEVRGTMVVDNRPVIVNRINVIHLDGSGHVPCDP